MVELSIERKNVKEKNAIEKNAKDKNAKDKNRERVKYLERLREQNVQ